MSFDVHFLSRDHLLDRARPMTAGEAEGVLRALKAVTPDLNGSSDDRLYEEYQVEAYDGGAVELYTSASDAGGTLVLRGLMASHCALTHEILRATNWAAVLVTMDGGHALLATSPVDAERGPDFVDEFGAGTATIVNSPRDVWNAMGGAFDAWRDWAGFDEAGRRKET